MSAVGADSIWIVLVITAATGAVFALYTTNLALQIGFTQFVGGTMGYGFLNELGPVLGGVAFAARVGAARGWWGALVRRPGVARGGGLDVWRPASVAGLGLGVGLAAAVAELDLAVAPGAVVVPAQA
mgnify:CR=1 FL=1